MPHATLARPMPQERGALVPRLVALAARAARVLGIGAPLADLGVRLFVAARLLPVGPDQDRQLGQHRVAVRERIRRAAAAARRSRPSAAPASSCSSRCCWSSAWARASRRSCCSSSTSSPSSRIPTSAPRASRTTRLWGLLLLVTLLHGPGALSLDRLIGRRCLRRLRAAHADREAQDELGPQHRHRRRRLRRHDARAPPRAACLPPASGSCSSARRATRRSTRCSPRSSARQCSPSTSSRRSGRCCARSRFVMGRVTAVDWQRRVARRRARSPGRQEIDFEQLVFAFGTRANLDLVPGLAEHALPLKLVGDAMFIRNRVLQRVARIELESDPLLRRRLGHFVVIGGGFSGVEVAGQLADFLRGVRRYYPRVDADELRVTVLEGADRLLLEMPESLGRAAQLARCAQRGVDVRLGARAARVDVDGVTLAGGTRLDAATVVCTIGTQAESARRAARRRPAARPHRHRRRSLGARPRRRLGDRRLRAGPQPRRATQRRRHADAAGVRAADGAVRRRRSARAGAQHRRADRRPADAARSRTSRKERWRRPAI